jgi:hypothetical protein
MARSRSIGSSFPLHPGPAKRIPIQLEPFQTWVLDSFARLFQGEVPPINFRPSASSYFQPDVHFLDVRAVGKCRVHDAHVGEATVRRGGFCSTPIATGSADVGEDCSWTWGRGCP